MKEKEYYKEQLVQMIGEIEDSAALRYMFLIVKEIWHDEVETTK